MLRGSYVNLKNDAISSSILQPSAQKTNALPQLSLDFLLQVGLAVSVEREEKQWVILGDVSPYTCLAAPGTCGAGTPGGGDGGAAGGEGSGSGAGGASLAVWLRVVACTDNDGLITAGIGGAGLYIFCRQNAVS